MLSYPSIDPTLVKLGPLQIRRFLVELFREPGPGLGLVLSFMMSMGRVLSVVMGIGGLILFCTLS